MRKYPNHEKLTLLIKPSKKNIDSFLEGIKTVFRKARSSTQAQLIQTLNPKISGWGNYHRHVVSKETFSRLDKLIWHQTFRWAKRRHPKKNLTWIFHKYFKKIKGVAKRFSCTEVQEDGTVLEFTLRKMAYIPIRRHVKIQGHVHPFDKDYDEYFEKRTSEKWRNNSKRLSVENHISMFQKDECPCCKEKLTINQHWCICLKRKASTGGEYKSANMDIIHSYCHEEWQQRR